jgi:hypothetical protein
MALLSVPKGTHECTMFPASYDAFLLLAKCRLKLTLHLNTRRSNCMEELRAVANYRVHLHVPSLSFYLRMVTVSLICCVTRLWISPDTDWG